ncbi:hypothetical protein H2198_002542 [Neophaeococcomyces mojaviensis]|uniref:Uncharacterized protein n=1 Tax=Neophaeococcomyces mojaviensis TaxID=3383035 RepID=A0ACC3ADV9_9EURO|nr:hypothetical protein H2198_002542 [Knufia sp. JES_112]
MGSHIYHGAWINWSHGPIIGATLTLGERNGGLLTAFIATFVTLVGAQLWRILTYLFHQARSRDTPQDGLYHQQQVIFRNTASPGSAAWNFIQQTWTWNGRAKLAFLRTVPWALFSFGYMALFTVLAVFSSDISKTPGSARIIIGDTCGYWANQGFDAEALKAYAARVSNNSLVSSSYARTCYGGSHDALSCSKFTKPSLKWTADTNATCPFASGTCIWNDKSAFKASSTMIDSLHDLGINSRESDRITFQKVATCAPLNAEEYVRKLKGGEESGKGIEGDTIFEFMFGPSISGLTGAIITNATYSYNTHTTMDNVGYKLDSEMYQPGSTSAGGWAPVKAINQTSADFNLMFLTANSIYYAEPVDDPMFSAHIGQDLSSVVAGATYYNADNYVAVMGCTDQYQICNPNNNQCSGLVGALQILTTIANDHQRIDFNTVQQAIASRIAITAQESSIHYQVFTRMGSALKASDILTNTLSQTLPVNQWQLEVGGWFDAGLAHIQLKTVEYATGPSNIGPGSYVQTPESDDTVGQAMCNSQMVNDTSDSMSFSILGMIILFVVGGFIIITAIWLDSIIGWFQMKFNIGTHARMAWLLDDKLQLHRFLNQELNLGQWIHEPNSMPKTKTSEEFPSLAVAQSLQMQERGGKTPYMAEQTTAYQGAPTPYQPTTYQPVQYQAPSYPAPNYQVYTRVTSEEVYERPKA